MSAEMHSSFQALRQQCGMVVHRKKRPVDFTPDTLADIARIEAMWANARAKHGQGGPFLFGAFSAADAMYAPVVCRFDIYQPQLSAATRAYMDAVTATPAWKKWMAGAAAETWRIPRFNEPELKPRLSHAVAPAHGADRARCDGAALQSSRTAPVDGGHDHAKI